ncbi:MAG: hypothetical protein C5B59_17455 [Bacteroidetes bacterium]|nr:MAG: hypothetical protein C5B59_17455 [Bacteroidota bacterium]
MRDYYVRNKRTGIRVPISELPLSKILFDIRRIKSGVAPIKAGSQLTAQDLLDRLEIELIIRRMDGRL